MEENAVVSRAAVLEKTWALMQDGQPRMAKQIAAELVKQGLAGVDKSLVNSVLSREGKGTFVYDAASYSYRLGDGSAMPDTSAMADEVVAAGPAVDRAAVLAAARALLADGEPRMAKQIAAALTQQGLAGVDKSVVNSVLAREGKGLFEYDRASFAYSLAGTE